MKMMIYFRDLDEFLRANNHLDWQENGQKIQINFVTGNHLDHISNIFIKLTIVQNPALSKLNRDNMSNKV